MKRALIAAVVVLAGGAAVWRLTRPAGTVFLEVHVAPDVAGKVETPRLRAEIERALVAALDAKVNVEVVFRPDSFRSRLRDTLAERTKGERVALATAGKRYHGLVGRADSVDLAELDGALRDYERARAALRARVGRGPHLDLDDNRLGIEITGAAGHRTARLGNERWATIRAGYVTSVVGDTAKRHRSLANLVVQAVGSLAGLAFERGDLQRAMVSGYPLDPTSLEKRDADYVRFTPEESRIVLACALAEE